MLVRYAQGSLLHQDGVASAARDPRDRRRIPQQVQEALVSADTSGASVSICCFEEVPASNRRPLTVAVDAWVETVAGLSSQRATMLLLAAEGRIGPELVGLVHRLVPVTMRPGDIDRQRDDFVERVIPENLRCAEGFVAVRFMVGSTTGKGLVSTVWRDMDVVRVVDQLAPARRRRGRARNIDIGQPAYMRIVLSVRPAHHATGPGATPPAFG